MFNLGPLEVIAILVVALVVFGPARLPEIGKQVGRAIREVKKFQSSLQDEVKDVFDVSEKPSHPGWPMTTQQREAAEAAAAGTPAPADGAAPAPAPAEPGAANHEVPKPIPGQTDLFGGETEAHDVPAGPDESTPR